MCTTLWYPSDYHLYLCLTVLRYFDLCLSCFFLFVFYVILIFAWVFCYPTWNVHFLTLVWRAVYKTLYPVCPQMENKDIYECLRCVYHDLLLRSSRLLVGQAIVCVYHVNQYTPCPPKLCAFKSATSLLPFRPNSRHHVHFTSCTLKATRYIYTYIYVKCQEVSPHGSRQSVLKARNLNENKVGKNDFWKSIIKGLLWKQTVVHS